MSRRHRQPFAAALLGVALATVLAAAPQLQAQSLWLPRDSDHAVMLEMLRPNVERVDGEIFSAAYFLSGRVCVSDRIAVVGELPYARFAGTVSYNSGYPFYGFYFGDISESSIGNPYLGIETRATSTPLFFELGVRTPLASDTEWIALFHGQRTDRLRWNAFDSDMASIQAAVNVREETDHHMAYRLRLSPVLTLPSAAEEDLWAHYSLEIGYAGRWARVGAGMSGIALLTGSGNLGARAANQFDVRGDFLGGAIRPGLALRIPMGSAATSVPVVFGVTLAWVQ